MRAFCARPALAGHLVHSAQVTYDGLRMLRQNRGFHKHTESLQELADLESALQEQHEVNVSLQQTQGDLSAYEAELEAQLKIRDAEASQLKEELEKLRRFSQVSSSIKPSRIQALWS